MLIPLLLAVAQAQAAPPAPTPSSTPVATPKKVRIKTRSVVMGVRGLDEVNLKAAKPDHKALAELDKYAASAPALDEFARYRSGKLVAVAPGTPDKYEQKDLEDEATFGREIAATLLGGAPLVKEPELQKYVNLVGAWIALRSDRPDLKWRFGVLASDSVNAFAVPGGYVFVTLALYQKIRTESELAGILGHEISHVVSRDHYNLLVMGRTIKMGGQMVRNMMSKMPAFKSLADLTIDHAVSVLSCTLDRNAEVSADRLGMVLAADAGYEPFGLARVLRALSLVPRDDSKAALLFKTHPTPDERIAAVEAASKGRLESRKDRPDMRERFEEYDLSSKKLERK